MTRDDAIQMMSCRLYNLLRVMMMAWRHWRPEELTYKGPSMFATGGSVSSFEDLENEADRAAIDVLEAGWDGLSIAERSFIEQTVGLVPWVWTVRESVAEEAIRKLEKKLREIG